MTAPTRTPEAAQSSPVRGGADIIPRESNRFMRAPAGSTRMLIAAIELGILADYLLRADDPGLGLTLWCWALLVAALVVGARMSVATDRRRLALLGAIAFFATVPAWRTSEPLVLFSGLAVLTLLVMSAWAAGAPAVVLAASTLASYLRAAWTGFVHIVVGAVPLIAAEARAHAGAGTRSRRTAGAALRGLALSLPIVLVLGALLVKADPAFESVVGGLLRWDAATIVEHLFLAGAFTWLAAAYLYASVSWGSPEAARPTGLRLGVIEGGMVLGVVNLLFLSFMLVQLQYLFGGTEHVLETAGLTYAEYARRGFFELLGVTALTLPVLIGVSAAVHPESALEQRVHRALTAGLVVLLLALVMSAASRMRLYQVEYGWTLARVYATALMLWIAGCILWFAATALRGRAQRFAFGGIAGGLALLGVMVVSNPAALVIRANAGRVASGHDFDGIHAVSMTHDAIPALLQALPVVAPTLDSDERCFIRTHLEDARVRLETNSDWRAWNLGRARARAAIEQHAESIPRLLGSEPCVRTRAGAAAASTQAPATAPASGSTPTDESAVALPPASTTGSATEVPPPR